MPFVFVSRWCAKPIQFVYNFVCYYFCELYYYNLTFLYVLLMKVVLMFVRCVLLAKDAKGATYKTINLKGFLIKGWISNMGFWRNIVSLKNYKTKENDSCRTGRRKNKTFSLNSHNVRDLISYNWFCVSIEFS